MPLYAATLRARLWPFVGICGLALAATLLRTADTEWSLVAAAAAVTALLSAASVIALRMRPLRPILAILPFAVDLVLCLLRQAQGGSTSGYAPLAVLPVIWVGLTRGRAWVAL